MFRKFRDVHVLFAIFLKQYSVLDQKQSSSAISSPKMYIYFGQDGWILASFFFCVLISVHILIHIIVHTIIHITKGAKAAIFQNGG